MTDDQDGRPLSDRGQKTRQRLLEAGTRVISERGLHAARVDDVVKAAGTSHGTFYLYFSSKEDLFAQLAAEVAAELAAVVEGFPVLGGSITSRGRLRERLDRFATVYERYGPVIRAWADGAVPTSNQAAGSGGTSDGTWTGVTGSLTAKVRIPKSVGLDPAITTLALLVMCERLNHYSFTGQMTATRHELLDTMVEIIQAVTTP